MRKELITTATPDTAPRDSTWLDLDSTATVQVTSEQEGFPIEGALLEGGTGWRAASEGTQTIRLIFDKPQKLSRIWMVFDESENIRTQEFVLRRSPDSGRFFEKAGVIWARG